MNKKFLLSFFLLYILVGFTTFNTVNGSGMVVQFAEFNEFSMIENHTFEIYDGSEQFASWDESGSVEQSSTYAYYSTAQNSNAARLWGAPYAGSSKVSQILTSVSRDTMQGKEILFSFLFLGASTDMVKAEIRTIDPVNGVTLLEGPWVEANGWNTYTYAESIAPDVTTVEISIIAEGASESTGFSVYIDEAKLSFFTSIDADSISGQYGDLGLAVEVSEITDFGNDRYVFIRLASIYNLDKQDGETGGPGRNGFVLQKGTMEGIKSNDNQDLSLDYHTEGNDAGIIGSPPDPSSPAVPEWAISLGQAAFWYGVGYATGGVSTATAIGISAIEMGSGELINYWLNSDDTGDIDPYSHPSDGDMKISNEYDYTGDNWNQLSYDDYAKAGGISQYLLWKVPDDSGAVSLNLKFNYKIGELQYFADNLGFPGGIGPWSGPGWYDVTVHEESIQTAVWTNPTAPPSSPAPLVSMISATSTATATDINVNLDWDQTDISVLTIKYFKSSDSTVNQSDVLAATHQMPYDETGEQNYNDQYTAPWTGYYRAYYYIDVGGVIVEEGWFSGTYFFDLTIPDTPPATPNQPAGPVSFKRFTAQTFTFFTTDVDSNTIHFHISWGDGNSGYYTWNKLADPGGLRIDKSYSSTGYKSIRARAYSDDDGNYNWSPAYSPSLTVNVTGSSSGPPGGPMSILPLPIAMSHVKEIDYISKSEIAKYDRITKLTKFN